MNIRISISLIVLIFVTSAQASNSFPNFVRFEDKVAASCPPEWRGIIDRVRSRRSKTQNEVKVLFSGVDGRVFNCIPIDISITDLRVLEDLEKDKARIISNRAPILPGAMPVNLCNVAVNISSKKLFEYIIYLPYSRDLLKSVFCKISIENSLKNIFN